MIHIKKKVRGALRLVQYMLGCEGFVTVNGYVLSSEKHDKEA